MKESQKILGWCKEALHHGVGHDKCKHFFVPDNEVMAAYHAAQDKVQEAVAKVKELDDVFKRRQD